MTIRLVRIKESQHATPDGGYEAYRIPLYSGRLGWGVYRGTERITIVGTLAEVKVAIAEDIADLKEKP